jgi:mono/diheme cytochrome c family protein
MNPRAIAAAVVVTLLLAGTALWRLPGASPVEASTGDKSASLDRVARGKYLVAATGCGDCHTPMKMGDKGPEPDMTRMLSGHPDFIKLPPAPAAQGVWGISAALTMTAWSGPWGTSFTANLTPDKETGLGKWTEGNFVQTIRNGRHMGVGRPILPPMPIPAFVNFSDDDLKSIFAYLQTVPVVKNRVPAPLPPAAAH